MHSNQHMPGRFRRRARNVVAALAAVALVAACGSDSDSDTSPVASATPTANADDADDAGSGDDAGTDAGGSDWDAIVEAAEQEGKVTFYTAQGLDQANQLKEAFEAEYPEITLDIVRDISSNLIPKIEAERQTGRGIADVYVSADTVWWADNSAAGELVPVAGPNFEADEFADDLLHDDGNYFEPSAVVFGFGWNTDLVPDGLTTLTDVLAPEFAGGKIGVVEPSLEALVDFYKYLEELYGEEFVEQLAAQQPRIYPGSGPMREALAAGEIAVSTYTSPLVDLQAAGAPVDYVIPETAWGARFFGGVLGTAPHPNAAQVLTNFIVSRAGQESLVWSRSVAVLPDIPGAGAPITAIRRAQSYTPEEITAYQDHWRSLFQG